MSTSEKPANTATSTHGDHDRVQMLSLKADGTPDQVNPEIIGDAEVAENAAKEQFAQQAVSAVDQAQNAGPVTLVGQKDGSVKEVAATTGEDPSIESAKKAHDEAAAAAEKAASKTVGALHKDA